MSTPVRPGVVRAARVSVIAFFCASILFGVIPWAVSLMNVRGPLDWFVEFGWLIWGPFGVVAVVLPVASRKSAP